ncbi:MAG: phenylacetate--CoA ligase family protein [Candidatus Woesearchaeota archaeon]
MDEKQLVEELKKVVSHALNSKLYSSKFDQLDFKLKNISDFKKLPFTTKEDLKKDYPFSNLCVDLKDVIEVHTSSGTTGQPQITFLTKKDLEIASNYVSKAWKEFGVNEKSVVQFIMSYGLFSGAMLNTFAIQKLGALVIPTGIISTKKQIEFMQEFGTDIIVATPSYYLYLYDYMKQNNIPRSSIKLKIGIAAGEVYSESIRKEIEKKLNIKIFDHYGLCEVYTGIAFECQNKNGFHILDEFVYSEVIDPATGKEVDVGEKGELVLTTLKKEASPLIRYRTNDLVVKLDSCCCEIKSSKVSRIIKRIDDVIFIKGIKFDPYEVKEILNRQFKKDFYNEMQFVIPKNLKSEYPKVILVPRIKNTDKDIIKKIIKNETNLNFDVEFVDISYFRNAIETKIKLVKWK